jgi:hypothetical protein
MCLLPLCAVGLMALSAAGGSFFRGGDEDDGLERHTKSNKKLKTITAQVPHPTAPVPPPAITPTCIWPGVACTTDVGWVVLSGQDLGTIPTEIGLLTALGELRY